MTSNNPISQIKNYGQSIWMDSLSRDLIHSGELEQQIEKNGICGITSNPTIFEKAIVGNATYDADIEAGIRAGKNVQEIYESLIFKDIQDACDVLYAVYEESNGLDGYVSIEVPPTIAHDTEATIQEARRYFEQIGRENVMIKIPGTLSGFKAIEQVISEGINVNVTLLFSVDSYLASAEAYMRGLEKRLEQGQDISKVASVASFFLSRIDSKVDQMVDERIKTVGTESLSEKARLSSIKGKVAIANAKIAYVKYKDLIASDRWQRLADQGAKPQRLLWASTGTKDPNYSDVMYVDELVGPETVNTLPPATIEACADHCHPDNRIETGIEEAYQLLDSLKDPDINISLDQVMEEVLSEGIDKFIQPFQSLMGSLEGKAKKLAPA